MIKRLQALQMRWVTVLLQVERLAVAFGTMAQRTEEILAMQRQLQRLRDETAWIELTSKHQGHSKGYALEVPFGETRRMQRPVIYPGPVLVEVVGTFLIERLTCCGAIVAEDVRSAEMELRPGDVWEVTIRNLLERA